MPEALCFASCFPTTLTYSFKFKRALKLHKTNWCLSSAYMVYMASTNSDTRPCSPVCGCIWHIWLFPDSTSGHYSVVCAVYAAHSQILFSPLKNTIWCLQATMSFSSYHNSQTTLRCHFQTHKGGKWCHWYPHLWCGRYGKHGTRVWDVVSCEF